VTAAANNAEMEAAASDELAPDASVSAIDGSTALQLPPPPADPSAAPRIATWLVPRAEFLAHVAPAVAANRKVWRPFTELLPSLSGLGTMSRLALADVMRRAAFNSGDVVCAGFEMLQQCLFVVDGAVAVWFQGTELKRLHRGEAFVCHPATDVARCSVVAAARHTVVARVAEAHFLTLPLHVQHHVAKLARHYSLD
jgi:hypothetical protein